MSVRRVGGVLVVSTLLAGLPPAAAADPPVELPRPGCVHRLPDADGDAYFDPTGTGATDPAVSSTDALDITGVYLRVTADDVVGLVALKALPADGAGLPPYAASYRYELSFKAPGGKTVTGTVELLNPAMDLPDAAPVDLYAGDSSDYPKATVGATTVAGASLTLWPSTATAPGYAVYKLPRAATETLLGAPLAPGDVLTDVAATTSITAPVEDVRAFEVDTNDTSGADYTATVGDDYCFGPPPAALTDVVVPETDFGDTARIEAVLTAEDGVALPGRPVTFALPSSAPVVVTTDEDGVASVDLPVGLAAGTYPVSVSFAGEPENGAAAASGELVVTTESTSFAALLVTKVSATGRAVTATVSDDDPAPLAGQKVDWYVNGKKVATVPTGGTGKSTYKGAKAGQTVQAKLAAVPGKYAPSSSKWVKLA